MAVSEPELKSAVREISAAVCAMVSEADSLGDRVPRSEWIAADAAAHLAITQSIFADLVVGGNNPFAGFEPERYGAVNARLLADNPGRDPRGLALAIARGTDDFLAAVAAAPPGDNYDSPLGQMDLTTLLSYCMCHLLMHGHGIALALNRPTPVSSRHATMAMPFVKHSVPFAYATRKKRGIDACVEFRLRGVPRFWIAFTAHAAQVSHRPVGTVDCHISTDPLSFLMVVLGHAGPLGLLLRGRALAWGRRPWIALKLSELLPGL